MGLVRMKSELGHSLTLTCCQARWSKYLSQFNLKIHFRPGWLGSKPDAMTRQWDFHPAGDEITPTNVQPILDPSQLAAKYTATTPETLTKDEPTTPDVWDHAHLLAEIVSHTPNNPLACKIIDSISKGDPLTSWHLQDNLLCFEDRTYVPDQILLCLQVIRNHHDHPTSGHFGQHKMAELVGQAFYWQGLKSMINRYMSSCTTCTRSKTP